MCLQTVLKGFKTCSPSAHWRNVRTHPRSHICLRVFTCTVCLSSAVQCWYKQASLKLPCTFESMSTSHAFIGLTGCYCLQLPTKRIILPIQRTCLHAIGQLNQTTAWHSYAVYQIELACLHPANHVALYSCKGECDSWLAHWLFVMNLVQIERGKRWLQFKVCQTLLSLQDCSTFEVQFNELFVKWLVNECLKLPLDLPFLIHNIPHPNRQ